MGLSAVYMKMEGSHHWTDGISQWAADGRLDFLSWVALTVICVLLIFAVTMTWAIISGDLIKKGKTVEALPKTATAAAEAAADAATTAAPAKYKYSDKLKTGAAQEPFLILLFFFTVFLGISHLFGLALAFHDKDEFKRTGNPALYMKSISAPPAAPTPTPTPLPTPTPFTFGFESASALLKMEDPPQVSSEEDRSFKKRQRKERQDGEGVYAKMNDLAQKILDAADGRARVEIVGHSDSQDLHGGAYKSNQELAVARAENVKYKIMKELSFLDEGRWHDIEWVCESESNEGVNNKRMVEVFIRQVPHDLATSQVPRLEAQLLPLVNTEKAHPLDLMDYVYFANYTITTTGYGDIIPNTPRSKFICSFANICEVFFLVVLFNTLLTLKQDKNEIELQQAREAGAVEERKLLEEIRKAVNKDLEQHASPDGLNLKSLSEMIEKNNTMLAEQLQSLDDKNKEEMAGDIAKKVLAKLEEAVDAKVNAAMDGKSVLDSVLGIFRRHPKSTSKK